MPRSSGGAPSGYNLLRCQMKNVPGKLNASVLTVPSSPELKENLKGFLPDVEWHTYFHTVKRNGSAHWLGIKSGDILLSLIPETKKLRLSTYAELKRNLEGSKPFDIYVLRRNKRIKLAPPKSTASAAKLSKRKAATASTTAAAKKRRNNEANEKKRLQSMHKKQKRDSTLPVKQAVKRMTNKNDGNREKSNGKKSVTMEGNVSSKKGRNKKGNLSSHVLVTPDKKNPTVGKEGTDSDTRLDLSTAQSAKISMKKTTSHGEADDRRENTILPPTGTNQPGKKSISESSSFEANMNNTGRYDDNTDTAASCEKDTGSDHAITPTIVTPSKLNAGSSLTQDENAVAGLKNAASGENYTTIIDAEIVDSTGEPSVQPTHPGKTDNENGPSSSTLGNDAISDILKELPKQNEGQNRESVVPRLMQLLEEPNRVSRFVANDGLKKAFELLEGTASNEIHIIAWELVDASQRWLDCSDKLLSLGIHRHIVRSLEICETEDLFQVLVCVFLSPVMDSNSSLHEFVLTEGAILSLLNAMHRHQSTAELIVECFRVLNRSLIHGKDARAIKDADGLSKIAFIMDRLKDSEEAQRAGKEFIMNILGC